MPKMSDDLDCLAGGGEMGALMRSVDWSTSPIGPVRMKGPSREEKDDLDQGCAAVRIGTNRAAEMAAPS